MQGKNKLILNRYLEKNLRKSVNAKYSCLVFGPRQTGKTFLVKKIFGDLKNTIEYPFQNPSVRLEIETNPGRIIQQIEVLQKPAFVFVDEAQKIPAVFDSAQFLIDEKKATFVLTGSSARKLKRKGSNLLPGRIKRFFFGSISLGRARFDQKK